MSAIMGKKMAQQQISAKSLPFWIFCSAFKMVDKINGWVENTRVNIIDSEPIGEIFIFILVFKKSSLIANGVKWVYSRKCFYATPVFNDHMPFPPVCFCPFVRKQ